MCLFNLEGQHYTQSLLLTRLSLSEREVATYHFSPAKQSIPQTPSPNRSSLPLPENHLGSFMKTYLEYLGVFPESLRSFIASSKGCEALRWWCWHLPCYFLRHRVVCSLLKFWLRLLWQTWCLWSISKWEAVTSLQVFRCLLQLQGHVSEASMNFVTYFSGYGWLNVLHFFRNPLGNKMLVSPTHWHPWFLWAPPAPSPATHTLCFWRKQGYKILLSTRRLQWPSFHPTPQFMRKRKDEARDWHMYGRGGIQS